MISVIVPVLDAKPWLAAQLEALSTQRFDRAWELIVADNGSTDGSVEVANRSVKRFAHFKLIDARARRGPGAARNMGAAQASGELLAFCDADDVVSPGWLDGLVSALVDADVVAGSFDTTSLNDAAVSPPSPPTTYQLGFLPAGLGSNLAVRREVFEELGGFSEDLHVGEDVDLCWRAQLSGRRFAFAPAAVVAKREHEGLGGVFRRSLDYGRSGPVLFKRYRERGARRQLAGWLKTLAWLIGSSVRLGDGRIRRQWVRTAGIRIGRLIGSIEQRTFFP